MRLDADGLTADPDQVNADLRRLGLFTGTVADGAYFMAQIAVLYDPFKLESLRRWRAAYLGRYMHQQLSTIADVPSVELWSYVREITELIKHETPTVAMTG